MFCVFIGFVGIFFFPLLRNSAYTRLFVDKQTHEEKHRPACPGNSEEHLSSTSTQFALELILQSRLCCCQVGTLGNSSGLGTGCIGDVTGQLE